MTDSFMKIASGEKLLLYREKRIRRPDLYMVSVVVLTTLCPILNSASETNAKQLQTENAVQ